MDAVRTVEAEVRELIRRSGLDPARDPKAVKRLVRDAVADYDQRSMHGGMPVLDDVDRAEKSVWDTVAGFGPLQQYFDDPDVKHETCGMLVQVEALRGWGSCGAFCVLLRGGTSGAGDLEARREPGGGA